MLRRIVFKGFASRDVSQRGVVGAQIIRHLIFSFLAAIEFVRG